MMNKKTLFGGILVICIVAVAALAFADSGYGGPMMGYGGHRMGPGYGGGYMMGPGYGGGYMMGPGYGGPMMNWGNGYGPYGRGYGYNGYANLSPKQREALDAAREKFFRETRDLRNRIYEKQVELHNEMLKNNPDRAKVVGLQKDISKLQGEFDQIAIQHQLDMRKLLPDSAQGPRSGAWGGGYCW